MATLSYQVYMLKNWQSYNTIGFSTGTSHNINLELLLQRSSIDNPLYTRRGSQFTASLSFTPPYSLFDGKDYASMSAADKQKLLEYHKWKFKAKVFTPLLPLTVKRTPVLMSRVEYGFLGHYNSNKVSPFETFYMGGDGMTGYTGMTATETIALRGYENGSIAGGGGSVPFGYAYSRLGLELRYPFLLEPSSTIYGVAFVEAGNAWATLKEFNPFALKRSAGVGVRIFLPMIGLMGLDWAYGFDIPDYSSQRGGSNLHFILGQEF
jgi:outer membrane protein insertion porin family